MVENMKKLYLLGLAALLLAGCSDNGSDAEDVFGPGKKKGKTVTVSGVVQRGFGETTVGDSIQLGSRLAPEYWIGEWGESVGIDSTGNFSASVVGLKINYAELYSPSNIPLSAALDVSKSNTANVNYLTSLITESVWHYMEQGMAYEEAWSKAAKSLLKNLHMPENLTDFTHYSLYGEGEGDAMLAALSIVIERSVMSGAWRVFEMDTATGLFREEEAFKKISANVAGLVYGDKLDSLRKAVEAKSPTGKVANYEKYLSVIFADGEGYDRCTEENQGKLIGYEDYYYASIVCDKSVWRKAHLGDFIGPKYNPDLTYGMYIDDRDHHVYMTINIGGKLWMADNLNYADSSATPNLAGQSWCYDNDSTNCNVFGRMYTWSAAMDLPSAFLDSSYDEEEGFHQGICPEGWHIPTDEELNSVTFEGSPLSAFMTGSDNASGFSVIPGGAAYAETEYGDSDEYTGVMHFEAMESYTNIWIRNEYNSRNAEAWYYRYSMEGGRAQAYSELNDKHHGFYVRCLKDY